MNEQQSNNSIYMDDLTPQEIVQELDKFIVGQGNAKKMVAIALRNRWRRQKLEPEVAAEITPKNILMIGPTGVGKTEIARRLAKITQAPFIKVEATKFTEVGYVGRDVESIIRDLTEMAFKTYKKDAQTKMLIKAAEKTETKILDIICPFIKNTDEEKKLREDFIKKIRSGELDEREIEVQITPKKIGIEIFGTKGMEEVTDQIEGLLKNFQPQNDKKKQKLKIKDAKELLTEEIAESMVDEAEIKTNAVNNVEENGIVFIDEIDKIAMRSNSGSSGSDISREGVQRDLLPLIEGTIVNTKYGMIKTDHILFITSGAFHYCKPSDLIPELQGRLPIRVELAALTIENFIQILKSTHSSIINQYISLLGVEGFDLRVNDDAIDLIANMAYKVNEKTENIGARRLYTIMEQLLEDISFNAPQMTKTGVKRVVINQDYVRTKLESKTEDSNISRYIL